jgi:hypothetical protein
MEMRNPADWRVRADVLERRNMLGKVWTRCVTDAMWARFSTVFGAHSGMACCRSIMGSMAQHDYLVVKLVTSLLVVVLLLRFLWIPKTPVSGAMYTVHVNG